jgi:ferredoxin
MLVIHPDECIDCGVCEPECPVEAIKPDTEEGAEKWLKLNADYSKIWPNITIKRDAPVDAKEWEGKADKLQYFSPIRAKATSARQIVYAHGHALGSRTSTHKSRLVSRVVGRCPLWVISGHVQRNWGCPLWAKSRHCTVHSITSSAIDITPDGMVRSSALAVLRLIRNSYLVACTTGRSAGFSPLRIRPM